MQIQFLLRQALFTEFIYHTVFAINRFLIFSPQREIFNNLVSRKYK